MMSLVGKDIELDAAVGRLFSPYLTVTLTWAAYFVLRRRCSLVV